MKGFLKAAAVAAMSTAVAAHSIWVEFEVNGVLQGHINGLRVPSYDGPIQDVTSNSLACNGDPNPLVDFSPNVIPVAAGATITVHWSQALDIDWRTGLVIDPSHKGPIMAYLSKVSDALGPIPNSGWFKIWEEGYDSSSGLWAVDKLIAARGYSFPIPSCVAPGQYLLRVELIALHAASNYPGAQLYMECAQLAISGSGSLSPTTYNIPGIYSGTDPGIKFNLYQTPIQYTIPGPRPITCGGSGSTPTTIKTTTTSAKATTTASVATTTPVKITTTASAVTTTKSTTTAATKTTSASGAGQTLYGQCGGTGWTGPTTCSSGTCKALNDYYSQCS